MLRLESCSAIPPWPQPTSNAVLIPVGTAIARWGVYTPHLNCMHVAKPYDGYRSMDECGDDLTWSGTLSVSRSR